MMPNFLQVRLATVLILCGTWVVDVASQGIAHPSTAMALRQQWGSLAEEVADSLHAVPRTTIDLWVQKVADSVLVQNAFLEALQRRGFSPTLESEKDSVELRLMVTVLTDRAQAREVGPDRYERTIQTDLEARSESDNGRVVQVLGMFHRTLIDTVSAREAELPLPIAATTGEEHASLFQRFVGPLIVLASGVIIVYLFFTVRS